MTKEVQAAEAVFATHYGIRPWEIGLLTEGQFDRLVAALPQKVEG